MEVPAMAVNGMVPTLSPPLVLFLVMTVCGTVMLVAAMLVRNFRLVFEKRLSPFNPLDLQRAGDPSFSTRPAGSRPFSQTAYARLAAFLVGVGAGGVVIERLWALFSA